MLSSVALAAALSLTPAQVGQLQLTNPHATYGLLGAKRTDLKFLPGDNFFLSFDIEGLQVNEFGKVLYSMSMELKSNKDNKVVFRREPVEQEAFNSLGGSQLPAFAQAEVGLDTPAGEYTVTVRVTDRRAKTTQDLDLMMSLWADDATFVNTSTGITYVGADQIHAFWRGSGSFTHHRFSLVPSYKTTIEVHGDRAFLYFECHDVGDYDQPDRQIVSDTFLAGTTHRAGMQWVFYEMTAGKASPLSVDHYYYP